MISTSRRRQRSGYFPIEADSPAPLIARLKYRARFSDVDPMAVVWHGRYANLFEQASEELGRRISPPPSVSSFLSSGLTRRRKSPIRPITWRRLPILRTTPTRFPTRSMKAWSSLKL